MGNYNSGRREGTPSTDDCVRINLSDLRREGAVKRHCMANRTHRWAIACVLVSDLLLTVDIDCLALSPCLRIRGVAFGRQVDSFEADLHAPRIAGEDAMRAVFIRAPWVEEIGPGVEVLARVEGGPNAGTIVAVQQGNVMATSFHPEITADTRVHDYFVRLVQAS